LRPAPAGGNLANTLCRLTCGLLLVLLARAGQAQAPQVRLDLLAASSNLSDQTFVYVEANATAGYDAAYDASKFSNPNGLNLSSLIAGGQQLAINGLPPSAFAAPLTVRLFVGIPQDDTYRLQVGLLSNFSFANVYLVDAQLQTRQLLATGTTYSFVLTGAATGGTYLTNTRFSLVFEPAFSPLPVALTAFTAQAQGADGLLRWTTASELHNDYFVLESAADGVHFQPLGRVAGHGTSAQAHTYQLIDADLGRYATAQVHYRLRQVDTNGAATYSPVRVLAVPLAPGLLVQAYPNPAAAGAAIALAVRTSEAGLATLTLTDAQGRTVGQGQAALPVGTTHVPLPGGGGRAAGLYLLRVQQGAQQQVLKLVLH
jgi:hypothetical protein